MKRPPGVLAFSILFIFYGLVWLGGIVVSSIWTLRGQTQESLASMPFLMIRSGLVFSGTKGIAWLIAGIGVRGLQNWARLLCLFIAAIFGPTELLSVIAFPMPGLTSRVVLSLTVLVWYSLILWYFLRPAVKAQFTNEAISNK